MTYNNIVKLFYKLIRVSLGIDADIDRDSITPQEWNYLFELSKKQAIVGVCFSGVTKIKSKVIPKCEPPSQLFFKWLAMAANIQRRNQVLNKHCVKLQQLFAAGGFRSCVLKGQGAAILYPDKLKGMRQSGDIDVWVIPNKNEDYDTHFERVMNFIKDFSPIYNFNKQHVALPLFNDVEVEVHFTPSIMFNPRYNAQLQKWFADNSQLMCVTKDGITTPTLAFNIVYMLQHCYNHLLFEGIGLRQVIDYYFVLQNINLNDDDKNKLRKTLCSLGLAKFSSAIGWVLQETFHLGREKQIFEPNEKEGRFFLKEIMKGGNFGKYGDDNIMCQHGKGNIVFFAARMKRNLRFLRHYRDEILWSPFGMIAHKYWKQKTLKKHLFTYDIFYL